jgi:predicted KAP-like P-loop ATPase
LTGGSDSRGARYSQEQKNEYDSLLLGAADPKNKERLRRGLKRIFPRLESVWGNLLYGQDSLVGWERERRVCAKSRFDSYFRFSIGDDALRKDEIDSLIKNARDENFIKENLRRSLEIIRPDGSTKTALVLDELNLHSQEVPDEAVEPLLTAIFDVVDELDTPRDVARGFSIGDNPLRVHWLMRRLTLERFDLNDRSTIIVRCSKNASLGWLVDLATSAYEAHFPREGKSPESEQRCITTKQDAELLRLQALKAIRKAVKAGRLIAHAKLAYLLFRWRDFAKDNGKQVKRWTKAELTKDDHVVMFAKALTSHGWSQSIEDTVARRTTVASVSGLELILDVAGFRKRIDSVLASGRLSEDQQLTLSEFVEAWKRHETQRS